ncbi:UNVERIFIED_CONTAM: hypothetical protein FKN15_070098 [Acipenser sinensis]
MSNTFVTLAEVLEARRGPLEEDEIWSLLLRTAESLPDASYKGHKNICNIISPGSLLLSANGQLAFKNNALGVDLCPFKAPEVIQGRASTTHLAIEKMLVYSLGMTLYWCVDYHVPQNQTKKGKSGSSQRDLSVIMPSGQCIEVKCDIKSKARDVFDLVVAHANLVEHFYFGLAFIDDNEFFFVDHETKLSKVVPEGWKKGAPVRFTLFLRIKFFVDNISFIQHRLTRHQHYLQLRKDILEERLYCNDETALQLGAIALQAEYGDYLPEVYGKNYFQLEHYIPGSVMEKMALTCLKEELPRLHANYSRLSAEEAEIEYLKVLQQLPEYGVLFHRVAREKKVVPGHLVLGICAKGIIVYEVKNNSRIASLRFQWRETESISSSRRKFTVESSSSGKKHVFLTESSKISKYLLSLCSAQHKFQNEMNSRQLTLNPPTGSQNKIALPEREIICATLKKDPKLGLGFIIVGEDKTRKLDLGIFIASIIPGGPADKDGRIKPDQITPQWSKKHKVQGNHCNIEGKYDSQTTLTTENHLSLNELETITPCSGAKVHVDRIMDTQDGGPESVLKDNVKPREVYCVELRKTDGSLGISVTVVQLLLQRGQHTAAESHSPGIKRARAAFQVSKMRKDNYAAVSMATPLSVNVKDYSFVTDEWKYTCGETLEIHDLARPRHSQVIRTPCKDQYQFCYKVLVEVLQGILELHGNQQQQQKLF